MGFQPGDLVAQQKAAFLQTPQRQVVFGSWRLAQAVDQVVEIGVFDAQFDELPLRGVQVLDHRSEHDEKMSEEAEEAIPQFIVFPMRETSLGFRLVAATAIDRGDRLYQQDQVEICPHPRVPGCLLAVVADGMGGKSGGRKAADQVLLIARQLFERFAPSKDKPEALLAQVLNESHLMIKLTAITAEQEPHSTIAACLIMPSLEAHVLHAGDTRVYHFRGSTLVRRTLDHSLVQRMVEEGAISATEAETHPQSHLLTGCLGADDDPPLELHRIEHLEVGDSLLLCSDGLWHYFTGRELGTIVHALKPSDASKMLASKARQRAKGGGDNLSLALVKVEALA